MKESHSSHFSPTFCVYPFMHFLAGPSEHWRICCVSGEGVMDENKESYLLQNHSPKTLWNSEGIRRIRKKMWEGKKISHCRHCYYQESVKQKSYRQRSNEEWLKNSKVRKIISESVKNDFYVKESPLYVDLRPGNLCNLRCRMCNPGNSSKIEKEWKELKSHEGFRKAVGNRMSVFQSQRKEKHEIPWENREEFWKGMEDWMEGLTKLYLTGGEPTLIKNNWKLIDRLIETKQSQFVELVFNINCTYIPQKLLNTFDCFQRVCLNLSLDALGTANDYIRDLSSWNQIEDNVKKLLQAAKGKNVDFMLTPVVQVYNILGLCKLFHWIDHLEKEFSRKISIDLLILDDDPSCLDIRILPESVRKVSLKRMRDYLRNSERNKWDELFKNSAESVIYILENVIHSKRDYLLHQFKQYTSFLDKHRKNNFEKSLPELSRFISLKDRKEGKLWP